MSMVVPQPRSSIRRAVFGVVEVGATEERADDCAAEADVVDEAEFAARVGGGEQIGCLHWAGP